MQTISRTLFLEALTAVQPGLASKELIQQSNTFVFKDKQVITFNDEIAVRHPLDIDLEGSVQAEELYKLLKRLTSDEIQLEVSGNELKVKAGRSRSGIRLENEIVLPLDAIGQPEKWRRLPENFCEAVHSCLFSVSNDMSKPVLTCLHLSGSSVTSCDNFRVTRRHFDSKVFPQERLLPGVAASKLMAYSPSHFSFTDGWIHFKNEKGVFFSCRSYTDTYPDMSDILQVSGESIKIPEAACDVLTRAEVFSKAEFTQDEKVEVILAEKRMTIKSKGPSGWFEESLPLKYKGDEIIFTVHPGFFKDVLAILSDLVICEGRIKLEGDHFEHLVITYAGM